MSMNINKTRAAVMLGQISALTMQIETLRIYAKRTGEDVTADIAALTAEITALTNIIADSDK